jgi:tetratricopeptide (TPR) repeat protein
LESSLANREDIASLMAVAYLGQGFQYLNSGELMAAREVFQTGQDYNEFDVRLWHGEAITWFRQGQFMEAASVLDRALGVESNNALTYRLLGQVYYAGGFMRESLDSLEKAKQLGDQESAVLLNKVRQDWEFERDMDQQTESHFNISFVGGGASELFANQVLEILEDAYIDLGSELAFYPDFSVPVLLYSRRDFVDVTRSPDWAGAVYDGKIRLPLAGLNEMTQEFKAILYHEYMHVLVHYMSNGRAPFWLNEGLAEVAGRRFHTKQLFDLKKEHLSEQMLDWGDLEKPFVRLSQETIPMAYEQSYSIVQYMVEHFGWHNISDLLLGLRLDPHWPDLVEATYSEYGMNWTAILSEWESSLAM